MRQILELLNRERGLSLDARTYERIREWRDWWRGYHAPFHSFREQDSAGGTVRRQLFSMRMAKKVCEDWACILLNEQTSLTLSHPPSSAFLQGKAGDGGILRQCRFWQRANRLVEEAFSSGTGAFVLRLAGMDIGSGGHIRKSPNARLELDYLPASCILPLTVRNGEILEAAFASELLRGGRRILYLQTHTLRGQGYTIENRCFSFENGSLVEIPIQQGIARRIHTGSPIPLFSIVRPNTVSTGDADDGMGEAVFAGAIDNLKGVDLAFNNLCRDFQLGTKKVFYNRSLLQPTSTGALLAPDDICQQLFVAVGDRMPDESQLIYEHNPTLRVAENVQGIQAQLDYLSFKCGLGPKFYRFDAGQVVTATQYVGDRQELMRNAQKHMLLLQESLRGVARMILWAGAAVLDADTRPDTDIRISFDDSVIIDRESERERDRADISAGLMRAYEYRMKWYGEDEAAARAAIREIEGADNTQ